MKDTSLLPLGLLRPYLRLIEVAVWLTLGAFILFVLAVPLEPARRWNILVFVGTAGTWVFLLFHHLIARFTQHAWFYYLQFTISAVYALLAGFVLSDYLFAIDVLMALSVVTAAIIGRRRLSLYTAGLSSLVALALEGYLTYQGLATWILFVLRLLGYSTLALVVSTAVENLFAAWRRSATDADRQLRQLQAMHELATAIGSSLDFREVLDLALDKTIEALKMDAGLIALTGADEGELQVSAQRGLPDEVAQTLSDHRVRVGEGLAGTAAALRRPTFSDDLANDPRMVTTHLRDAGYRSYISIPLIVGKQVVGVLGVVSHTRHSPDTHELTFLQAIGEQIGLAVQRARSYGQEQSQRRLAQTFSRVAQAAGDSPDLDAVMDIVLGELQQVVPYHSAAIMLKKGRRLQVRAARGYPAGLSLSAMDVDLDGPGLLSQAALEGRPMVIPDARADPRWEIRPGFEYVRGWAAVPLVSQDLDMGLLTIDRLEPNTIRPDELELLSAFATRAAVSIEKAQLFQQSRRRMEMLSAVNQVGQAISAPLELGRVLQTVYEQAVRLTNNRDFYIALYDEITGEVDFPYYYEQGQLQPRQKRRNANGLTEHVIRTRRPLLINQDVIGFAEKMGIQPHGARSYSWMGVPLIKRDKVIGVMAVQNYEREYAYDDEDLELFETLAGQVAVAIDNARLYEGTRRSLQEAAALYEFSRRISQSTDRQLIAQAAAWACSQVLSLYRAVVYAYDGDASPLTALAIVEPKDEGTLPAAGGTRDESKDEVGRMKDEKNSSAFDSSLPVHAPRGFGSLGGGKYPSGSIGWVLGHAQAVRLGDVRLDGLYGGSADALAALDGSQLCVPIVLQERVLGVIDIESRELNAYDERDERFARALAGQLATALENARLMENERQRTFELSGLYEVSQAFGAMGDPRATYAEVTRRLAQIFNSEAAVIFLHDREHSEMRAQAPAYGVVNETMLNLRYSLDGTTQALWDPYRDPAWIVNDLSALPENANVFLQQFPLHRFMGAAMFGREGLIGVTYVINRPGQNPFTQRDGQLLAVCARQAALAIENARLVENERLNRQQLALINQVGQHASATLELTTLLRQMVEFIRDRFHFHTVALFFVEDGMLALQTVAGGFGSPGGGFATQSLAGHRQPISQGVPGWVVRQRRPRLVNDAQQDSEFAGPTGVQSELAVPLVARGDVIGVLDVTGDAPNQFSESDVVLLSTIADQVTQAIVNSRLYERERQGRQQLSLVNRVARRILSINSLPLLMQEIASAVEDTLRYPLVTTFLVEKDTIVLTGSAGPQARLLPVPYTRPVGEGSFGLAVRTGQTQIANNLKESRHHTDRLQLGLQSEIAVPLSVVGRVIGLLVASADHPNAFGTGDLTTLETVADQAAQAIANVRSYEAEQRRANQLATIATLGREMASLLNLDALMQRAVALTRERFGFHTVHVFVADHGRGVACLAAGASHGQRSPVESLELRIGQDGLIGKAVGERRPILANDVRQNPDYYEHPSLTGILSELVVPIRLGERVLGALDAQDDRLNAFGEDDLFIMQTLADQLAVAMVNAELHMAVEHQARTDSVTQVFNHGYFLQRLREEVERGQRQGYDVSLIMLDIDYFKQYNDRYGHVVGDSVLQATAQAIRQNIKRDDLVGRWGGEEFGVALPGATPQSALLVAERIRKSLANFPLADAHGRLVEKPTVSQGIATFPMHAPSFEELVNLADQMLYEAKAQGRDQVVMYADAVLEMSTIRVG